MGVTMPFKRVCLRSRVVNCVLRTKPGSFQFLLYVLSKREGLRIRIKKKSPHPGAHCDMNRALPCVPGRTPEAASESRNRGSGVLGTFQAVGGCAARQSQDRAAYGPLQRVAAVPVYKYTGGIIQKCIFAFQRQRNQCASKEQKGCTAPSHHPKPLGFRFGKKKKISQICHLGRQLLTTTGPALLKIQDVGSVPLLRKWWRGACTGPWAETCSPKSAETHGDLVLARGHVHTDHCLLSVQTQLFATE